MAINTEESKKILIEEKIKIESELSTIATRNPEQTADWNTTYPDMNILPAEKEEVASQETEFENRASEELGLESRLRDINDALEKIEQGKYGICSVGGEPIDEARMLANRASTTCVAHGN